jgi:hypothetical protein
MYGAADNWIQERRVKMAVCRDIRKKWFWAYFIDFVCIFARITDDLAGIPLTMR